MNFGLPVVSSVIETLILFLISIFLFYSIDKYGCDDESSVWCPKPYTIFKLLLSARFCSAFLSNISDCDETFNYWEPVSTAVNCGY